MRLNECSRESKGKKQKNEQKPRQATLENMYQNGLFIVRHILASDTCGVRFNTHFFLCFCLYLRLCSCLRRTCEPALHGRKIPHRIPTVIRPSFGCVFIVERRQGEGRIVLVWFVWLRNKPNNNYKNQSFSKVYVFSEFDLFTRKRSSVTCLNLSTLESALSFVWTGENNVYIFK